MGMRPEKELIVRLMQAEGVHKSDLARRLGKYRSTVCDTLGSNGHRSMLVSDLVEYADALGYKLTLTATRKETK